MSDLQIVQNFSNLVYLYAMNKRGAAWLKNWCCEEDPPTTDHDGRKFIVICSDQLRKTLDAAIRAGLKTE
jgi:hypothetical protein